MLGRSTEEAATTGNEAGTVSQSGSQRATQESASGVFSGLIDATRGDILPVNEDDVLASFLPEYEVPTVDECVQLGGGERLDDNLNLAWGELDGSDQEFVDGQDLPLF